MTSRSGTSANASHLDGSAILPARATCPAVLYCVGREWSRVERRSRESPRRTDVGISNQRAQGICVPNHDAGSGWLDTLLCGYVLLTCMLYGEYGVRHGSFFPARRKSINKTRNTKKCWLGCGSGWAGYTSVGILISAILHLSLLLLIFFLALPCIASYYAHRTVLGQKLKMEKEL
ncbi:hypothetical protein BKA61DRAFT_321232 [Leptodontidium sp. MPI-SDFR-AT-0119]|nr:hypothetical protein BKA61DRAFT_321232 [Leptodontidium sp. MPI-SDFR-AT-0119]